MLDRFRTNKTPLDDRSWSGLLVQLFFFFILPIAIILLAVSVISQAMHEQAMRAMVAERNQRAVTAAATAIEEDIRERISFLNLLASQAEQLDLEALERSYSGAELVTAQFDGGVALLSEQGDLHILYAGDGSLASLANRLEAPRLNLLAGPLTHFMSDAFSSPVSDSRLLVILEAAPGRGYLAAGAVTVRNLTQPSMESLAAADHSSEYYLVDRERQALLTHGLASITGDLSGRPGIEDVLQGRSGTTYHKKGKTEQVVAYSPLPILGWGLVNEEAWEMVSTPSLRITQLAPLILAPFMLLMLLAMWYGARQIVDPLRKLEERASRLAWGDYQAIQEPVNGLAEIRSLHAELVRMAEKVQAAQKGMQEYAGVVTSAQEDERRRLAQELHDDTIQALIALKQRVQIIRMKMKNRLAEQEQEELKNLLALAEQTIANLRRQIRALRPIYLDDLGLATALEMLVQEFRQMANLEMVFRCSGEQRRLEDTVELALYRIAQEALHNVVRHAHASSAEVELTFEPQAATLVIADDGVGFAVPRSPAELAIKGHFGLLGIAERADGIGAALEIQSTPGKGARLKVSYPIPVSSAAETGLGDNA